MNQYLINLLSSKRLTQLNNIAKYAGKKCTPKVLV